MTNSSKRIYLSPPHVTENERELLLDAFDSNWIAPLGPHVDAFEKEFAQKVDMPHAVALSSGTAALHLSLRLSGVSAGDEVLTSTLTFVATANAVTYCGAKPVFIDSERDTWNMDPQLLEDELKECKANNRMPAAVLVVNILGQCADYESIEAICQKYDVALIEDAAESLGARVGDRNSGSFGKAGCFSFNGNKIITTSGGGMLVTDDEQLAKDARNLATQARDPAPHYQHSKIGYNYRLSNLLAAVGRGQLASIDKKVAARRNNFQKYHEALGSIDGIEFMPEPEGYHSNRWLTAITVDPKVSGVSREDLRIALEDKNIEARPVWKPMHAQPVFADCRSRISGVSDALFEDGLCLPSGSSLTDEQRDRVISNILDRHRKGNQA